MTASPQMRRLRHRETEAKVTDSVPGKRIPAVCPMVKTVLQPKPARFQTHMCTHKE